jgi:hypothetical protein
MHADAWSALAAWIGLALLAVAAVIAYLQVREARSLRREQARPFVTVDFVGRSVMIMVVLKNVGPTIARNVRVTFDPPLISSDANPHVKSVASDALEAGLPTLVPGREVRWFFDTMPARIDGDLPLRYTATIEYEGFDDERFSYPQILDLEPLAGALQSEPTITDVVDRLREIRDALKKK